MMPFIVVFKYSRIEYQDEIFKISLKLLLNSKCLNLALDVKFMTLKIYNFKFLFMLLEFNINLRASSKTIPTCTPLAPSSRNVYTSFKIVLVKNMLVDFVGQYVFKCL